MDVETTVAIQGELGSNSHVAALEVLAACGADQPKVLPCGLSAEVFEAVEAGTVECAVLPIENSLHGAVAEHYDLLLRHSVRISRESLLRVRHNVIAARGVRLEDVRCVMSHPVALAQCRAWLRAHPQIVVVPFYDTAGSVKHVMETGARDTAGIAPVLAAEQYGAKVLVEGIEDHAENYTRFYVLERGEQRHRQYENSGLVETTTDRGGEPNKVSLAFSVEHRPGTLLAALECFRAAGLNLTQIESRPVPGRPWQYVFFVDVRYENAVALDRALNALRGFCGMVKELGRYRAA